MIKRLKEMSLIFSVLYISSCSIPTWTKLNRFVLYNDQKVPISQLDEYIKIIHYFDPLSPEAKFFGYYGAGETHYVFKTKGEKYKIKQPKCSGCFYPVFKGDRYVSLKTDFIDDEKILREDVLVFLCEKNEIVLKKWRVRNCLFHFYNDYCIYFWLKDARVVVFDLRVEDFTGRKKFQGVVSDEEYFKLKRQEYYDVFKQNKNYTKINYYADGTFDVTPKKKEK